MNQARNTVTTILLLASLLLTSCASVVSAVSDDGIEEDPTRRTFGAMIDDGGIETKVRVNLNAADEGLKQANINVQSYNGTVLLVGQVPSQELKNLATRVARSSSNRIEVVHNELQVAGTTTLLSRSNDSWISAKLKTLMLADSEISGLRTKVVTENGVVYLMGLVTRRQADRIVELASSTGGVTKVVRAFEYVE